MSSEEIKFTRYEMETVINYNEEEPFAEIYTASKVTMRKLNKLCERFPEEYQLIKDDGFQATYRCLKRYIRFGSPAKMTDEQKEAVRQRLSQWREHRDRYDNDEVDEEIGDELEDAPDNEDGEDY